jgi:hypothetical protein
VIASSSPGSADHFLESIRTTAEVARPLVDGKVKKIPRQHAPAGDNMASIILFLPQRVL